MAPDLTKRGTPRRRPARTGEGRPTSPEHLTRKRRAPYLSDQELRDRGWDGRESAGGFIQRLVLSCPKGKPLIEVLDLDED